MELVTIHILDSAAVSAVKRIIETFGGRIVGEEPINQRPSWLGPAFNAVCGGLCLRVQICTDAANDLATLFGGRIIALMERAS